MNKFVEFEPKMKAFDSIFFPLLLLLRFTWSSGAAFVLGDKLVKKLSHDFILFFSLLPKLFNYQLHIFVPLSLFWVNF